jgi:hypothetical protein
LPGLEDRVLAAVWLPPLNTNHAFHVRQTPVLKYTPTGFESIVPAPIPK